MQWPSTGWCFWVLINALLYELYIFGWSNGSRSSNGRCFTEPCYRKRATKRSIVVWSGASLTLKCRYLICCSELHFFIINVPNEVYKFLRRVKQNHCNHHNIVVVLLYKPMGDICATLYIYFLFLDWKFCSIPGHLSLLLKI